GLPDIFARSDPQWQWASLFICHLLCIDVDDGSGRFRHAFWTFWGCPDHTGVRLKSQANGDPSACQRSRTQADLPKTCPVLRLPAPRRLEDLFRTIEALAELF